MHFIVYIIFNIYLKSKIYARNNQKKKFKIRAYSYSIFNRKTYQMAMTWDSEWISHN